jgi:hypothetical protein
VVEVVGSAEDCILLESCLGEVTVTDQSELDGGKERTKPPDFSADRQLMSGAR